MSGDTHSRLADFPEMYEVRSPGILSLSALRKGGDGSFDRPINDSSDSSGLVRVVPAGLIFDRSKEKELSVSTDDVIELAARIAALTQGNPLGFVPAAALAEIVSSLTFGLVSDIKTAVTSTMEKIRYHFGDDEDVNHFLKLIDKAIGLAESDLSDREAIPLLGEGWDADEAVAIAVFCSIRHSDDFEEGLIASVNHRGNSNSTGAVTGSILGAGLGYENIPDKFTKKLELRKMILEFAEVLFHRIQIA